jgi:NADH dehydrogenase subunit 5 C-terminus
LDCFTKFIGINSYLKLIYLYITRYFNHTNLVTKVTVPNVSSIQNGRFQFVVKKEIYNFLMFKWYFDVIYNEIINRPLLSFAYNSTFNSFDKGFLEIFGPFGISKVLFNGAFELRKMHLGQVYYYAYFMVLFLMSSVITMHYIIN